MEIALIIIAYILNVFLNRWLNYIIYKNDKVKATFIWFFSIIGTVVFLARMIINYFSKPNWFTGSDWNKVITPKEITVIELINLGFERTSENSLGLVLDFTEMYYDIPLGVLLVGNIESNVETIDDVSTLIRLFK